MIYERECYMNKLYYKRFGIIANILDIVCIIAFFSIFACIEFGIFTLSEAVLLLLCGVVFIPVCHRSYNYIKQCPIGGLVGTLMVSFMLALAVSVIVVFVALIETKE